MFGGKRELLAHGLFWSGATFVMGHLPERDSLLVLNYYRIGNAADDPFDSELFSATGDQFNDQISYLKRHFSVVTLEEAVAFIGGAHKDKRRQCRVLITFDDGYLDNFSLAFPVLRSHGVQGVFFLATSIVGSCYIPWWDHIGYVMKTARQRRFSLRYPGELAVDIDKNGMARSLRAVLSLYERAVDADFAKFLHELKDAARADDPPREVRRFLNWDEAREMIAGGMAIGSHTHSHLVLSHLGPDQQRQELSQSRDLLRQQMHTAVDTLAYPIGGTNCFSQQTMKIAEEEGYQAAFSFYGGTNMPGNTARYDVKRIAVYDQSRARFRVQASVCRLTGKYWP